MATRRHAVERHRRATIGIFLGALVIGGPFTFMPGASCTRLRSGPESHLQGELDAHRLVPEPAGLPVVAGSAMIFATCRL